MATAITSGFGRIGRTIFRVLNASKCVCSRSCIYPEANPALEEINNLIRFLVNQVVDVIDFAKCCVIRHGHSDNCCNVKIKEINSVP